MTGSDEIPMAVIGVGYLGQWHARKLAGIEGIKLTAVVDRDSDRCNGLAEELDCTPVENYRKIPELAKAAVVAVPTVGHFEVARHLLEKGMDLLVEKPLGADLEKATLLADRADEMNLILAVGLVERFNPGVMAGLEAIEEPRWIETRRLAPFKERTRDVDVVRDLLIHDLDIACAIAGTEGEVVEAVSTSELTGIPDAVRTCVKFENGLEAFLHASRMHDGEVRDIEVYDKRGRMLINTRTRAAFRFKPGPLGMEPFALPTERKDPLEEELRDFAVAVKNRSRPRVTAREGIRALRLATDILNLIGA